MRPLASVLLFKSIGRPKPAKATLRPDTQRGVREVQYLAPFLGEQNPKVVPDVVRYMRAMMPAPPPSEGLEAEEPRATAAHGTEAPAKPKRREPRVLFLWHTLPLEFQLKETREPVTRARHRTAV